MALVLCTGVDETLLQTRRLILERAGHQVIPATDEKALLAACEKHSFDVAVIGQAISPKMKRRVGRLVRELCPATRILELYAPHEGKVLDDADASLLVPADVPNVLADRVEDLAKQKKGPS
jgi:CheY-like chemotaxis protein